MEKKIHIQDTFMEIGAKSLDERKRLPIGSALKSLLSNISRFKIFCSNNGDVLLRPVVEIDAREAWLFKNKKALTSVKRGLKQSAQGKTKKFDMNRLAPED